MIFNSKQLEELENIHDSTGAFEEEGDDEAGFDEVGEAAMDWRRSLIEEAAENIKRAKTRPVEPHIQYNIGSMLFDREEKRFARVQRSVPGYLKIVYLSGGDREYGTLDVVAYLKDQGAEKRLSELSEQLGLPDVDVLIELERLGITPLEEPETPETPAEAAASAAAASAAAAGGAAVPPPFVRAQPKPVPKPAPAKAAAPAKKGAPAAAAEDDVDDADEDDEEATAAGPDEEPARPVGGKAPQKPTAGKPPARGTQPPMAASASKVPTAVKAKGPPAKPLNGSSSPASAKGTGVNPIDDPNGYIKAHFNEMSNRELARLTGLSEHTIRRKLGEWSLKRKKEI